MSGDTKNLQIPIGRLLYRAGDDNPFVVLQHNPTQQLYIGPEGWDSNSEVTRSLAPQDALRALRLANVNVPDGCELGPWQRGIGLFETMTLSFPVDEYVQIEAAWLLPALSQYSMALVNETEDVTCCAPPHHKPKIKWDVIHSEYSLDELQEMAHAKFGSKDLTVAGELTDEWNAHPSGSIVIATPMRLTGDFIVVDLPPIDENSR